MSAADIDDSFARDALDWVTRTLLERAAAGAWRPAATLFLLRRYVADGGDDVRDALEAALTGGLDGASSEPDPRERCQWLGVFADAASVSSDERLADAVNRSLAQTIDDLEQLIRSGYEPGEGLVGASLADQLRTALALVTAFELTGRLQYSMLAEELLQVARRASWDDDRGWFGRSAGTTGADDSYGENSDGVQLLSRLAALHRDPEYASSAVMAEHPAYDIDAARALASVRPCYREHPAEAAEFGLALLDWLALSGQPN